MLSLFYRYTKVWYVYTVSRVFFLWALEHIGKKAGSTHIFYDGGNDLYFEGITGISWKILENEVYLHSSYFKSYKLGCRQQYTLLAITCNHNIVFVWRFGYPVMHWASIFSWIFKNVKNLIVSLPQYATHLNRGPQNCQESIG